MNNVIPGTTNNPMYPGGPYAASEGVVSGFDQYLLDKETRAKARSRIDSEVSLGTSAPAAMTPKAVKVKPVKVAAVPKEVKVNDKRVAAERIFKEQADKGNGAIAKMIASELEITYANAYYYVTRVFKR